MERRLGTIFGFVFAILFLIGVIQCQMVTNLADAHRRTARTGEMIQNLALIERLLSDADGAVKTYVITRDTAALDACDAAATQVPPILQDLGKLAAQEGIPRQKIDELTSVTNTALSPLQKVAGERGSGRLSSASNMIAAQTGQKALSDAELALQTMEQEQRALLGQRNGAMAVTAKLAAFITMAGSAGALWLLVMIGLVLRRYVTERRQGSRSQVLSVQLLDNMAAGVLLSDETGMILYTNPAGDALFGYEPGELIGHNLSLINEFTSHGDGHQFDEIHQQLISHGAWKGEIPGRRRDGRPITCTVQVSALERGGKMHWISVAETLSEPSFQERPAPSITSESAAACEAPGGGLRAA